MSSVYMDLVLAACLFKAEPVLQSGPWSATNERQAKLVARLDQLRHLVERLPPGTLDAIGSNDAGPINEFLARNGFSITVPPLGDQDIATAAVLDILERWKVAGQFSEVRHGRKAYPAVELEGECFTVYETTDAPSRFVASIKTQGAAEVLVCAASSVEEGLFLMHAPNLPAASFSALRFPMVDLEMSVDVGWLCGLVRGDARVTKALAQAKLRVNDVGAHAKAAAAVVLTRSCSLTTNVLEIAEPFVIAFAFDGEIAVAFHVTPEHWKAPPDLGERRSPSRSAAVW